MPFISEMIDDANVQHGFNQTNSNSDPTSAVLIILSIFAAYILRSFIFVFLILLFKLSVLGIFAILAYKVFLT
jgi:hypothetical protein